MFLVSSEVTHLRPTASGKSWVPWHAGDADNYQGPNAASPIALGTSSIALATFPVHPVHDDSDEDTHPYVDDG